MSDAPKTKTQSTKTILVDGKQRYHEPAPTDMNVEAFRQVVTSRRSVRKFTDINQFQKKSWMIA